MFGLSQCIISLQAALKLVSFSGGSVYSEQLDLESRSRVTATGDKGDQGGTDTAAFTWRWCWNRQWRGGGVVVVVAYFGSGGPSARGFMESLHSERNTRKASFCRMWEKRAALWGPCSASASSMSVEETDERSSKMPFTCCPSVLTRGCGAADCSGAMCVWSP